MKTEEAHGCFFNYCATNPNASIIFYTSNMVVKTNSYAAYLVVSKAQSRTVGFIYMGNHNKNKHIINGLIMVIAQI